MKAVFVHWLSPAAVDLSALDIGFFTALVWLDGVVHRARAWVGQIVTFFAYSPPSLPLGSLTPTQPGSTLRLEGRLQPPVSAIPSKWAKASAAAEAAVVA
eukprot:scaffold6852_cov84-Phaeocystis_antarctica.AAC.1